MSLIGTLNVGKSALAIHQAAIQVTSNNVANAGNPDYTRQVARITPAGEHQLRPGVFVGTGVNLAGVERQIDLALEERIRASNSDYASAATRQQWLGRVESVFNELGDEDLSSELSTFFDGWTDLADRPLDTGLRQIVVQNGDSLASTLRGLRGQFDSLCGDADQQLAGLVNNANALANQIAQLNGQIVKAEAGASASANILRDQRDAALKQLSQLMDIKTQEMPGGAVNVLVGAVTLVSASQNRGLALTQSADGSSTLSIAADGTRLQPTSGQIGGLTAIRQEIAGVVDDLDTLASNLIFALNKIHASGQGLEGFTDVTSTNAVNDPAAALNSDAAGLAFKPVNGSLKVEVRDKNGSIVSAALVQVDLDGLNGDDDSLNSLAAELDAIQGVSASVVAGKLKIQADDKNATQITFSEDSSGVLAALGVNTFFTGTNAASIAVNATLKARPALLAAATSQGANLNARSIAALETTKLAAMQNMSLLDRHDAMINNLAVSTASAKNAAEAAAAVNETLTTQREALSGVSLDEEAINLIKEQRAFQGAARVISAVDEMIKTLLQMV